MSIVVSFYFQSERECHQNVLYSHKASTNQSARYFLTTYYFTTSLTLLLLVLILKEKPTTTTKCIFTWKTDE